MFSLLHVNDDYGVYNYSLTTPMHSSSAEVYDIQSSQQGRPHDYWPRNDIYFLILTPSFIFATVHFYLRSPPPPSSIFQTSWCV